MGVNREDSLDGAIVGFLEAEDAGRPVDRTDWVAAHPDFRDELTRFLADHDVFETSVAPLRAIAVSTAPRPPDPRLAPGSAVGDFELIEEIGRGGMGVVFRARDAVLGRVVALKMIRAGALATADDLRRFQREAHLVARLEHPNIVPVYQTGTADGLSFIALRLVEGGSLARHRDDYRDPRRAASLVATVARAVDFAHRHGILHRDLKPGNILLDADRVPHVTDFGLARPAEGEDTSSPAAGTPAYMAPEQATGGDVTTAADVWALGAILYELLTGRPPFHGPTPFGTLLDALSREPDRPRRLVPGLARDLEAICLTCLEKDPARRYATAAALGDDLDRWLRHEPVRARPVRAAARLWRWVRRHPLPAGLSGALAVAMLTGGVLVYTQWRRAEHNLDDANRQRQLVEDEWQDARRVLDEFCNRLSDERLSRLPGTGPIRRDLLQSGLRYYEHFLRQRSSDPRARQDVADAHFRLGALHAALGEKSAATAEYRTALDSYAAMEQSESVRRMTANARNNLGNLLWDAGDYAAARASYRAADAEWTAILADHPDSREALGGRAKAMINLAQLLEKSGDYDAGARMLAEALALQHRRVDSGPDDAGSRLDLAAGFHARANMLAAAGRHGEALEQLQRAAEQLDAAAKLAPWDASPRLERAEVRRACAGSLNALGRRDEAEAEYRECRSQVEALLTANPEVGQYRVALANVLANIGAVHAARKQVSDARAAYERSIGLLDRLLAEEPGSTRLMQSRGVAAHNLANLDRGDRRFADAEAEYRTAADSFRRSLAVAPNDPGTRYFLGGTLNNRADVLQQLGRPDEAIACFADAACELRAAHAAAPTRPQYRDQLAAILGNLARALQKAGRTEEADAALRERDRLRGAAAAPR